MSPTKTQRIRRQIESLRGHGGVKSAELEGLAEALGRARHPRGSEPAWVSKRFPWLRPLTIPHHSKEIKRYTAHSILDQLEEDLSAWEEEYEQGKKEGRE